MRMRDRRHHPRPGVRHGWSQSFPSQLLSERRFGWSLRVGKRLDDGIVECVGALSSSGNKVYIRALAKGHLRGQLVDDGTGIACVALDDGGGSDSTAVDDHGGFDL